MQDQDAPPVEEGETGGGVGVVRAAQTQVDGQDAISSTRAFTQPRWITAIAPLSPETTTDRDRGGSVRALRPTIRNPNPILCRFAKTPPRASLASSTICSFRPRFRKPRAS